MSIVDLDSATLQPLWQITAQGFWNTSGTALVYCYPDAPQMAIRGDGAVVVAAIGNTAGFPELMILNGKTGQSKPAPTIPLSSYSDPSGLQHAEYSRIGPSIVSSDDAAYVEYEVHQLAYPPKVVSAVLYLLKVASDGSSSTTTLSSTTLDEVLAPGRIIPWGAL